TTITSTSKALTGLTPGTKYIWKVKSVCGQGFSSAFSPNQNFTTLAGKIQSSEAGSEVSVYPNPVSDQFRISVPEGMSFPISCIIYDLYGNAVKTFTVNNYQQWIGIS